MRTLGCAISVLRKLILQLTDSLLLRQNCGLQILKLLQQPLKQLRLDPRRDGGTEGEKRKGKPTETRKKQREKENRSRIVCYKELKETCVKTGRIEQVEV